MSPVPPPSPTPVTEADLHGYVDQQLGAERQREVEAHLARHPEDRLSADSYLAQKRALRALFDPVLNEPVPSRLRHAARPRTGSQHPFWASPPWHLQRLAAAVAAAAVGGVAGWLLRGAENSGALQALRSGPPVVTMASASGLAQRAAVAHAVYSPDQRRAVEVSAEHEDQLVAWLSKRMGTPMKPPHLQDLGYALDGGRLLPGDQGPVAQFMYHDSLGAKLTLYVSHDVPAAANGNGIGAAKGQDAAKAGNQDTAFRFAQQGPVNVFYWVDGPFGYALSAGADKAELTRVSAEVYRQLAAPR